LWEALLADERSIRARLHDLFLDVTIDRENEIAFVRPVDYDAAPEVIRTRSLTFMDTAALLVLRQTLLAEEGRGRVFIGQDDLFEQLSVYRGTARDESDFRRRVNASWSNLRELGLLHTSEEGRAEISPIVRFLVDAPRVAAIQASYDRVAAGQTAPGQTAQDQTAPGRTSSSQPARDDEFGDSPDNPDNPENPYNPDNPDEAR
jgi:hypothetical protein